MTNSLGEIKARRDFLPFGEEIYAGVGGRNANQKYSSNADDTRLEERIKGLDRQNGATYEGFAGENLSSNAGNGPGTPESGGPIIWRIV